MAFRVSAIRPIPLASEYHGQFRSFCILPIRILYAEVSNRTKPTSIMIANQNPKQDLRLETYQ